jgi:23S rRNA pseudouridine1911/1915/1917 synthase
MNMKILYEDNHLIAVWKDAGILAQGDRSNVPSLMDDVKKYLKEKYKKPGNVFLGLLHRLDRPVAGIVLFAKTSKGASRLSEQFREREIVKKYYAVIEGTMPEKSGVLVHMIEKKTTMHGGRRAKVIKKFGDHPYQNSDGQAELAYETVRSGARYSLVKINLKTGKFHQIRVQFAAEGHPIAGDIKYGGHTSPVLTNGAITLAACEFSFTTATEERKITLKEPYPEQWNKLL